MSRRKQPRPPSRRGGATEEEFIAWWTERVLDRPPLDPPGRLEGDARERFRPRAWAIAEGLWRRKTPEEREQWRRAGRRRMRRWEARRGS